MIDTIPGTQLLKSEKGRVVIFDGGVTEDVFHAFLAAMMRDGVEFSLFDPAYPSPSDPGAHLSYCPQQGAWLMTLGNHGWSGGIYQIAPNIISRQLFDIHVKGQLKSLGLDKVCFFRHREPVSPESIEKMNKLLESLHA